MAGHAPVPANQRLFRLEFQVSRRPVPVSTTNMRRFLTIRPWVPQRRVHLARLISLLFSRSRNPVRLTRYLALRLNQQFRQTRNVTRDGRFHRRRDADCLMNAMEGWVAKCRQSGEGDAARGRSVEPVLAAGRPIGGCSGITRCPATRRRGCLERMWMTGGRELGRTAPQGRVRHF
jgi:hypothetical protein